MGRSILVIARCQENLGWLEQVPAHWLIRVVQKGLDMPNEGREPASFLWFILKEYDNLKKDDKIAFVQGNPFDHCKELGLERNIDQLTPIGNRKHITWGSGSPDDDEAGRKHREWFGVDMLLPIAFYAGGQFMIMGNKIKNRPKKFYQKLFDDMPDGRAPWALERLWSVIWK